MGNCLGCSSNSNSSINSDAHNRAIDKQLKVDEKKLKSEVKLLLLGRTTCHIEYFVLSNILLLGAGESGKSTVLKQMKLIHASGFDENERESFRLIVFTNIVIAMQLLTEAMDQLNIPLEHESYRVSANYFTRNPFLLKNL